MELCTVGQHMVNTRTGPIRPHSGCRLLLWCRCPESCRKTVPPGRKLSGQHWPRHWCFHFHTYKDRAAVCHVDFSACLVAYLCFFCVSLPDAWPSIGYAFLSVFEWEENSTCQRQCGPQLWPLPWRKEEMRSDMLYNQPPTPELSQLFIATPRLISVSHNTSRHLKDKKTVYLCMCVHLCTSVSVCLSVRGLTV